MNEPKVSIIVPTYNVEKYCRTCFDALLNQSLKDIEIILVDDGSTDNSGKICDEYSAKDQRVKVIHQTNRGLGLSRNSGLNVACGEYIGFVDSDDCVSEDMFRILYDNAHRLDADISYCKYIKFSNEDELLNHSQSNNNIVCWKGKEEIRQYMLDRVGMPPKEKEDCRFGASVCCGIFSKKLLDSQNARFVSERQFIAEDMIFDIDVIPCCTNIVHTDAELYYYRYNPNSLTTSYKPDRFWKNIELYHEMHKRLKYIFSEEEIFNPLSRYLITIARIAVIQEAKFININGFKKAYENCKRINKQRELVEVYKKYNWKKLPLKIRLFCFPQKNSFIIAQLIMCKYSIR